MGRVRLKGGVKLPAVHTPAGSSVEQMFVVVVVQCFVYLAR